MSDRGPLHPRHDLTVEQPHASWTYQDRASNSSSEKLFNFLIRKQK